MRIDFSMSEKEKKIIKKFESLKSPLQTKEVTDFLLTIEQKDLDNIFDNSMNEMVKDLVNDKNRFES